MPSKLPMFPLGNVIFPHTGFPLQVFEPRYLTMLRTLREGDGYFGSVLIERGAEVGGGDSRFTVGTRLRVIGEQEVGSELTAIVVAGTERIVVTDWLADDPHPWAMAEILADTTEAHDVSDRIDAVLARIETMLALLSELGENTSEIDLSIAADPTVASFQLAALTPVTPLDAYELLAVSSVDDRLDLNASLLDDQIEIIRAELSGDLE